MYNIHLDYNLHGGEAFFAKGDGLVIWYIKEGKLVGRSQMHLSLVSVREEESVCHILTRLD